MDMFNIQCIYSFWPFVDIDTPILFAVFSLSISFLLTYLYIIDLLVFSSLVTKDACGAEM